MPQMQGQGTYRSSLSNEESLDSSFDRTSYYLWGYTHQMMSECPGVVESNSDDDEYLLYNFVGGTSKPLKVLLTVNGKPLYMELDTGADLSIISEATRKTLFPNLRIHKSTVTLKTYTGEPIRLVGNLHVRVKYKGQLSLLSSLWKAIDQVS